MRRLIFLWLLLFGPVSVHGQSVWKEVGPYMYPVTGLYADSSLLYANTFWTDAGPAPIFSRFSRSFGDEWASSDPYVTTSPGVSTVTRSVNGWMFFAYSAISNSDIFVHYFTSSENGIPVHDFARIDDAKHLGDFHWVNPDTLLMTTGIGLYQLVPDRSNIPERIAFADTSMVDLTETRSGDLWVTSEHGLYRSHNRGRSWHRVFDEPFLSRVEVVYLDTERIMVGTTGNGLFVSDDYGENWRRSGGLQDASVAALIADITRTYVGTERGVFYSDDAGVEWVQTQVDIPVNSLARASGFLFAGTDRGVFRSKNDEVDWKRVGAPWAFVNDTYFDRETGRFLVGDEHVGIAYTDDLGETWHSSNLTYANIGRFVPLHKDGEIIAYPRWSAPSVISRDNGATWELYQDESPVLYVHPDRSMMLAAVDGVLARSLDEGQTWETVPTEGLDGPAHFSTVGLDKSIWFARYTGVHVLEAGTSSWRKAAWPCRDLCNEEFDFVKGPDGLVCAYQSKGTWACTSDAGRSGWETSPVTGQQIYISPEGDFYSETHRSRDGVSWEKFSEANPRELAVAPVAVTNDGVLLGYVERMGIYKTRIPVVVANENRELPFPGDNSFAVEIFPNPTLEQATIRISLNTVASISITVFDVLGRRLESSPDTQDYSAGIHEEMISFNHLPAGPYLVRISSGEHEVTRLIFKTAGND